MNVKNILQEAFERMNDTLDESFGSLSGIPSQGQKYLPALLASNPSTNYVSNKSRAVEISFVSFDDLKDQLVALSKQYGASVAAVVGENYDAFLFLRKSATEAKFGSEVVGAVFNASNPNGRGTGVAFKKFITLTSKSRCWAIFADAGVMSLRHGRQFDGMIGDGSSQRSLGDKFGVNRSGSTDFMDIARSVADDFREAKASKINVRNKITPQQAKEIAELKHKFAMIGGRPYRFPPEVDLKRELPVFAVNVKTGGVIGKVFPITEKMRFVNLAIDIIYEPHSGHIRLVDASGNTISESIECDVKILLHETVDRMDI